MGTLTYRFGKDFFIIFLFVGRYLLDKCHLFSGKEIPVSASAPADNQILYLSAKEVRSSEFRWELYPTI